MVSLLRVVQSAHPYVDSTTIRSETRPQEKHDIVSLDLITTTRPFSQGPVMADS